MFAITGKFSATKGLLDLFITVKLFSWADEIFCFLVPLVLDKFCSKLPLVVLDLVESLIWVAENPVAALLAGAEPRH